jgi:hypothetical protein
MECQKQHWRAVSMPHKAVCGPKAPVPPEFDGSWHDKWRGASDGSRHFGRLELITWDGESEDGDLLGFGGVFAEEADELRARFTEECGGSESRFVKVWSNGFRWTCCGVEIGLGLHGCDHHGDPRAFTSCGCDFCLAGQPLSESIWRKKLRSQAARGLPGLCRGPDPRSVSDAGRENWRLRQQHYAILGGGDSDDG